LKMPFNTSQRAELRKSIYLVLLLGVVSLFADMTYEGARSVAGPYLFALGAGAVAVGFATGFGEFLGYVLRYLSGHLADRTRRYWALVIFGYAISLSVIPALAFVGRWQEAIFLLILERLGKAIRTPARDALLSYATTRMGRGLGFGLHEAMDQIGALIAPLIFSNS